MMRGVRRISLYLFIGLMSLWKEGRGERLICMGSHQAFVILVMLTVGFSILHVYGAFKCASLWGSLMLSVESCMWGKGHGNLCDDSGQRYNLHVEGEGVLARAISPERYSLVYGKDCRG
jgi:hypothetical protein